MTWLRRRKDSTGNPFRRLSLVIKYRANIVCTSKLDVADVSADLDIVRNILFEATFFERMSFFEVRVSYNIVFTTAIALTHVIGHVTLRPVLRGQTTVRQREEAHHARLYEADDFSKIIHFGIILLINH